MKAAATEGALQPPTTLLLLPHANTRERLLAPGAPVMSRFGGVRLRSGDVLPVYWPGWATSHGIAWDDGRADHYVPADCRDDAHLVLARDGAEVYEGTDRLDRVLDTLPLGAVARVQAAGFCEEIAVLLGHEPDMDPAVALKRLRSIVAPLGTLVLLDADGKEVSGV